VLQVNTGEDGCPMSREFELKLEVAPDAIDALLQQPWLKRAECKSIKQVSTYYDTEDNELRRRGYSLRVRAADGRFIQTVKSLDSGAGVFERGEWEYQVDAGAPDAELLVGTPLAGLDVAPLRPVLSSDVTRLAFRLQPDGAEIELAIDNGCVSAAGRQQRVAEVEIEIVKGAPSCAVEIARTISAQVPVKLGVLSKAERGFGLAGGTLGQLTKSAPVALDASMTVAQAFERILSACIRHFRLNEAAVLEQRNPEALHQVRVAMRRLRAAMSLFRTAISDQEFARLRAELRWFTNRLGDARNLDVMLQRDFPGGQREQLLERRELAYDEVIAAIDSARLRTMMLDLVAWAALGDWHHNLRAGVPVGTYVARRIDKLWEKTARAHHVRLMDDEARHRLRIEVKKLRYGLEFVAALHAHEGKRQKRFGAALEGLQESLGKLNDIVVARTFAASESWTIEPNVQADDERELFHEANQALRALRKIGPYWR
jgi:inorganic triphosphatase YgiF